MQHLAIIPDGNRRWAKNNKIKSIWGHRKGMDTVKTAVDFCLNKGISFLSFYTFSLENFNRSEYEKKYLFGLISEYFKEHLEEFLEKKIRVKFVGNSSLFPEEVKPVIENVEKQTQDFDKLTVNLLFCYGAKQEILSAVKSIAEKVKAGEMDVDQISEDTFRSALWSGDVPDPDLILRTGGAQRLSNFLLYSAAYSEFTFLDVFWPEITKKHLEDVVDSFYSSKRNFGK